MDEGCIKVFNNNLDECLKTIVKIHKNYSTIAIDTGFPRWKPAKKEPANPPKNYDTFKNQIDLSNITSLGLFL